MRRTEVDRGAALVEFALALPFLAILTLGTVDMGRAYRTWNQVKNAAREGAAYAQTHPTFQEPVAGGCTNPHNILYHARSEVNFDSSFTVETTPVGSPDKCEPFSSSTTPASLQPGQTIAVRVEREFELLTPLVAAFVGTPTIGATVKVVIQGS